MPFKEVSQFIQKYEGVRNTHKEKICNLYTAATLFAPSYQEVTFIIEKGKGYGQPWDSYADRDTKRVIDRHGNKLELWRTRGIDDMVESIYSPSIETKCYAREGFTRTEEGRLFKEMKKSIDAVQRFKEDLKQAVKSGELKDFNFVRTHERIHS